MTAAGGAAPPLVLLSFRLGADEYAIELARVREIVPFVGATWLPGFAVAVRGAVDLRGEAVPAIELAAAFGLPASDPTAESCLLVVEAEPTGQRAAVGLIADAVRDIVELAPAELAAAPPELAGAAADHLAGLAARGDHFLRVVDLDRLLGSNPRVRGPADLAADGRGEGER
jgi:purine-binding chemotaxis protein CheW